MIITGLPPWPTPVLPPADFPHLKFDSAPGAINDAVAALTAALLRIESAEDHVRLAARVDGWSGASAQAFQSKVDTAAKKLADHRTTVDAVRATLAGWSTALEGYRRRARQYEHEAAAAAGVADDARMQAALDDVRLSANKLAEDHAQAADAVAAAIWRTEPLLDTLLKQGKAPPPWGRNPTSIPGTGHGTFATLPRQTSGPGSSGTPSRSGLLSSA